MRQILKGATDQSVIVRIIDSTDGTPETGVVWNTAGIAMWYRREGATVTAITEATLATTDAAHSDGGIIHLSDGYYRLDLPDAAVLTGVASVMVGGAVTGMIVIGTELQLVNYNPQDAVRFGLTALPNAAADAAGGLAISDAGGLDLDAKLANTNEVTAARMGALTDWINGGRLDLILDDILLDTGTTLDGIVDDILVDTAVIGALGAGLTALATAAELAKVPKSDAAVSWNATALAAIQTEANDALVANNLDHLALTATGAADMTTEVADNTILSRVLGNGDTSTFVPSTDGLHAAGVDIDAILADTNELQVDDYPTSIAAVKADTAAILTDTGTTLEADLDAIIAAVITNAAGVDIAADIIALKAETATILADTNELQVDDYPTSIAAVKADTAAILTDTGTTLDGRIPAALVGGRMDASVGAQANIDFGALQKASLNAAIPASVAGAVGGLAAAAITDVETAVSNQLNAAITEPANLSATKSVRNFLWHLYSRFFHKNTQTATEQITMKADGVTALATRTTSDDGTTQTLGAAS